jgi:hypothetical protein
VDKAAEPPAAQEAAKPEAASPEAAKAAVKPAAPKRVFQAPPKPGGNFPGKSGKGGPKPNMPKGRIFRHQGR